MPIFSIGYAGKTPAEILRLAEALDADIIDVRLNPRSRHHRWNNSSLQISLAGRYQHWKCFGNLLYKEGGMKIADHIVGIDTLHRMTRAVILMCGCAEFSTCHRAELVRLLMLSGFEYGGEADMLGVDMGGDQRQLSLFGDPSPAPKKKKVNTSPQQESLFPKAEWVGLLDKARARYWDDAVLDMALVELPATAELTIQNELPAPIHSDTEFWCDLYIPL